MCTATRSAMALVATFAGKQVSLLQFTPWEATSNTDGTYGWVLSNP